MAMVASKLKSNATKSSATLRLWCNSLTFVHSLVGGAVNLPVDFSAHPDPNIRAYNRKKWMLLTVWYNIVLGLYLPVCLYCDWYERRGEGPPHMAVLRRARDVVMTAFLFPVTIGGNIIFWVIFPNYRNYLAPDEFYEHIPVWSNYSLHTVTGIAVILDILLTPRQRPVSLKPQLAVLCVFTAAYCLIVSLCHFIGEEIYSFMVYFNKYDCLLTTLSMVAGFAFIFYLEWLTITYVWGNRQHGKKIY